MNVPRQAVAIFCVLVSLIWVQPVAAESTTFEEAPVPAEGWIALDSWTGSDMVGLQAGDAIVQTSVVGSGLQALEMTANASVIWSMDGTPLPELDYTARTSFMLRLDALATNAPVIPEQTLTAVLYAGSSGLMALDGNGSGFGTWQIVSSLSTTSFHEVTIIRDYTSGTYDVDVDSVPVATGLGFKDAWHGTSFFTSIESTSTYWLDNVSATLHLPHEDDTDPPTPDPMTWAAAPAATGPYSVSMTATTASDDNGVEYYFECTAGGGNDSGWQDSAFYLDSSLNPGTQYTYTVTARDKSTGQNETFPSTAESATTTGEAPGDPIPDVVGMDQAFAEAALVAAGFTVGIVTTDYSDTVPAGDVISQDPTGGTGAPGGTSVDLVVSLGVQMVTVPDVVGMAQATAESTITAAVLTVGTVTTAYSPTVPVGDVISQSPTAGASVVHDSPVDLVVSDGPQPVTVPDVVGLAQAAAEAAITAANLTVGTVTTDYSPTVPAGDVISQNPTGVASVLPGTSVDLVVSDGPVPVNTAPTASSVAITGTAEVGQVLTGTYTYNDADGDVEGTSTYRWLRDDVEISGATAQTYTLVATDQGRSIEFEVTPVAAIGVSPGTAVTSAPVAPAADTTPPVITLLGTTPLDIEFGSTYGDDGATATDNVDGDLTSSIATVNPVNTNALGTYIVTYDVTDSAGNAAVQVTRTVNVVDTTPPAPVAAFSASLTTGPAPLTVDFTDSSTGSVTAWAWEFGDGGTSTAQSPRHTYADAGTYTVSLTVTNANGPDTDTLTRTAYITVSDPGGGGGVPTGQGFILSKNSDFSTDDRTFSRNDTLHMLLYSDQVDSTNMNKMEWELKDANKNRVKQSLINNGDGTFTAAYSLSNLPSNLTAWTWKGKIEDKNKVKYQPTTIITVTEGAVSPVAAFSGSPTSGQANLAVSFTDQSSGSPTSWSWSFGDGGMSTDQNPSHTYTAVGTYTVSLTVTNAQGSGTKTRTNYITVTPPPTDPPTADFVVADTTPNTNQTVSFTDQSSGSPTSWSWNFGDGGTSTDQNPAHTYTAVGTYTVSLTVTNANGSDILTRTNYITVSDPGSVPTGQGFILSKNADFSTDDRTFSRNDTLYMLLHSDQVDFTDIRRNEWELKDPDKNRVKQNFTNNLDNTYIAAFNLAGLPSERPDWQWKGKVEDNAGNKFQVTDDITVLPAGSGSPPVADFTGTPTSGTASLSVNFTDSSTGNPTTWSWNFGDGGTSTAQNPTHLYNLDGTFTVSLTVTNANGSDILTRTNYITVSDPGSVPTGQGFILSKNADFSTDDRTFSRNDTLHMLLYSDQVDFNNLRKTEWELKDVNGPRVKQAFTNNGDGTFTAAFLLSDLPSNLTTWTWKGKVEDNNRVKYQATDSITVNP